MIDWEILAHDLPAIIGSTLVGLHFSSPLLGIGIGIGVYFCIVAIRTK